MVLQGGNVSPAKPASLAIRTTPDDLTSGAALDGEASSIGTPGSPVDSSGPAVGSDATAVGSPGPSVAPASPDKMALWRGATLGSADDSASIAAGWDQEEWRSPKRVLNPTRSLKKTLNRLQSGRRQKPQHEHQS